MLGPCAPGSVIAIAERTGTSGKTGEIGEGRLELLQQLFAHWHRCREGEIGWLQLQQRCRETRQLGSI